MMELPAAAALAATAVPVPEMLHVWLIAPPDGPFASDMSPDVLAALPAPRWLVLGDMGEVADVDRLLRAFRMNIEVMGRGEPGRVVGAAQEFVEGVELTAPRTDSRQRLPPALIAKLGRL